MKNEILNVTGDVLIDANLACAVDTYNRVSSEQKPTKTPPVGGETAIEIALKAALNKKYNTRL